MEYAKTLLVLALNATAAAVDETGAGAREAVIAAQAAIEAAIEKVDKELEGWYPNPRLRRSRPGPPG